MTESIIALVDCDSFFVSCEQAIDESLQGKPVCVLSNNNACVLARSMEAKELGITMGMPYFKAKKQFPDAVYLTGNIDTYKDFSRKIMAILRDFSPTVEVYSIDEAFVELSGLKKLYKTNYLGIAKLIRQTIKAEVGVDVSIGVSKSKVLAKLACEKAKPQRGVDSCGVYLIGSRKIPKILKTTKVQEIWGIGKNTTLQFNRWGILNCKELVEKPDEWLKLKSGKRGLELKHELLGECLDKVKTKRKLPKSIQNTRTFPKTTSDINYIKNALNKHIHTSCTKLRHLKGRCNSVGVMLRSKDFIMSYDKINLSKPTNFELEISRVALGLLDKMFDSNTIYRSCGVTLDGLDFSTESQLSLFMECENVKPDKSENYEKLGKAIDKLEKKFGKDTVRTGFYEE